MIAQNYLVIAMFLSFIALLATGFPVAWVLAGVGIGFAGIAWFTDNVLRWTMTGASLRRKRLTRSG